MRIQPPSSARGGSRTASYVIQFTYDMNPTPNLVIFDCDGVLADTEALDIHVVSHLLEEAGVHVSLEDVAKKGSGLTDDAMWTMVENELGQPLPEGIKERRESMLMDTFQECLTPTPGLRETVIQLTECGITLAVASNGSTEKVSAILDIIELSEPFGGRIFSAEMVSRPKPHSDLYLYAARQLETTPSRCVVIEDSRAGVHAGLAAGMRVLGFCPNEDVQDLEPLGVETFPHMDALPSLLGLDRLPC